MNGWPEHKRAIISTPPYLHVLLGPLMRLNLLGLVAQPFPHLLLKVTERAPVYGKLARVQVDDVGAHVVEELTGVGHHDYRACT